MTETETLGVIELTGRGSGFIRRVERSYLPSRGDVHVGRKLIQQHDLRTGDELAGEVGKPQGKGKSPTLTTLTTLNGQPPESLEKRPRFRDLTAIHPSEQLMLACGLTRLGAPDYTNRVIDLVSPLGLGQRAMIVAPAKAGKTMVLQALAEGIVKNRPDARLFILLVDERPEEVTEMESIGFGEVVASSFDFPPSRHAQVAEFTLERARRYVESGQHAVIVLDSITRLARAYNTLEKGTGRTLSGGLDAQAMEKPKRFLGSARNIHPDMGGGSLTIIGTALVDTGSRMDQVIFEEFKGTGNSELVLDREIADRRIYPAIDLNASATRREERLFTPEMLGLSHSLRQQLSSMSPTDAMSELLSLMKRTESNDELVEQFAARRSGR